MKKFFKRLFCSHKYKYKVLFTPVYYMTGTCVKCGKIKELF